MRHRNRTSFLLLTVAVFCTFSIIVSPYMIKKGFVAGLDGKANSIDYLPLWRNMPSFPGIVYCIGDFICHQKCSRSFVANGNQMPVCARDTGTFIGMCMGFALSLFVVPSAELAETALQFLPRRMRNTKKKALLIGISAAMISPVAIDGFLQLLTPYESTNVLRLLTGIPFGAAVACTISALILSTLAARR